MRPHPGHPNNGDENDYSNRNYIGNYSKGLPHFDCGDPLNLIGEVKPQPYRRMLRALASGQPYFFGRIPLGGTRRLVNPQSGLAFDLEGPDSHALRMPPAPRLDSQEAAGEMVELYWMARLRDVNFGNGDFAATPGSMIEIAAAELSNLPIFNGPKEVAGGMLKVTPHTIFRGFTRGDRIGPYVSQFLLQGTESDLLHPRPTDPPLDPLTLRYITYGSIRIDQKQRTILPGDFLTNFEDWLNGEQGVNSIPPNDQACGNNYDPTRRYIRNMRDLANYVHFDDLPQEFWNAALILQHLEAPCKPMPRGPVDRGNPYVSSENQDGFGTLGDPNILALIGEVTTRALKAAWFQKWFVHRRLRPEEFGALIHKQYAGVDISTTCTASAASFNYPFDRNILNPAGPFTILNEIFSQTNSYLLPQVYPEASPLHPSYPSGHATIAGACVTLLKAWFDESFVVPNPVIPNADGTALESYSGTLTVGDELDKLASNISLGRNAAGVHYRSDYVTGLQLGEEVAIQLLEEQKNTYNENFYLTLRRFDGQAITI